MGGFCQDRDQLGPTVLGLDAAQGFPRRHRATSPGLGKPVAPPLTVAIVVEPMVVANSKVLIVLAGS